MKLSPLSVPYRAVERGAGLLVPVAFLLVSGSASGMVPYGPLGGLFLLVAVVALVVGYEVAAYRAFEYAVTADTLDIRSGVLARRNREIPLRRIQNVDVSQNVVQRLLDVAEVSFETAGGSETEATVRFVSTAEAERIQREIRRRKRGATGDPDEGEEAAAEELFALSPRELAVVGALSFDLRVPGALLFLASGSAPVVSALLPAGSRTLLLALGGVAFILAVALFSWVVGAVVAVVNYYGFRLARTEDELLYERGLVRRYSGSIPLDKVQTITVEDNPLKRRFGYATLAIETAGYAPGQGSAQGTQAAVPLAEVERVEALARDIEPFGDPTFTRPPKRIRRRYALRYLLLLGVVAGAFAAADRILGGGVVPWYLLAALLPVVPVAAHYKWKHRGYWLDADHVVTRDGFWTRRTKVVPYYRVQTLIDSRTLFQRRWGVATLTVDTAGSLSVAGGDAAAVDVEEDDVDRLRDELGDRLRVALVERRGPAPVDRLAERPTGGE